MDWMEPGGKEQAFVMKQALDSHGNDEADSNSGKRMHGGIE
jgi:hypothetical protein